MADVAAVAAEAEVVAEAVDGVIRPVAEEAVAASWHLPLPLEVVSMVRLMSCVA